MNDKENGKIIVNNIDTLKKNINATWSDINTKETDKLKEVWNDPMSLEYIEKLKSVGKKIDEINNKLDILKSCWEKYINSVPNGNTNEGEQ